MDIVERLSGYNPPDRTVDEQRQMAIDIQDAKAEIERLRDALKPFAEAANHLDNTVIDYTSTRTIRAFTGADLRRARSALQQKESE